ncbi:Mbeg1-like protein [Massilistercora timonensis]|uniref:Mbeg1-like protein n=1 Tax=Massilistercora timonensis TaxID=2086584 RepID=UPI003209C78C
MYSLDIVNKDDSVPAICFNDPDDPEHAVVVFRGTSGKDEWIDNAIGLGVSDTERQKAALDYIENLPYDSITVAGHSKGGNKAQYVTVLSDKVDRCISMDGQGFSQEFIDKYYAEIQKKGHCIKNYYLEGDFVSILMFPVPGSDQICIDGDDSVIGAENHAASSFYQFWQDEEGR